MLKLKSFRQTPGLCGPASLKIVMDYYGISVSEAEIAEAAGAVKEKGVSVKGLIKAARHFKFKTFLKKNSRPSDLKRFVSKKIPVIVDWFSEDEGHYSVVIGIDKNNVFLMDPEKGKRKMRVGTFLRVWFDFPGKFIKKPGDLILRLMLAVTPK